MTLNELEKVLQSDGPWNVTFVDLYELNPYIELQVSCSIEFAFKHYGNRTVEHIKPFAGKLAIRLAKEENNNERSYKNG